MDDRNFLASQKTPPRYITEVDSEVKEKIAHHLDARSSEFFISPVLEDFVYATVRSLDIGDYWGTKDKKALWQHAINKNADLFNWDELNEPLPSELGGHPRYLTYRTAGVFLNHESSNPEAAIGLVFDSMLVPDVYDDMHAVILMGVDKKKAPNIARSLMTYPQRVLTSMGCSIKSSMCTACGHEIIKEDDFCNCLKYSRGSRKNGVRVAELLRGMSFHEQSVVTAPAAPKSAVIDAIHGLGLVPGKILKVASAEYADVTDPILRTMAAIYNSLREARTAQEKKRLGNQLDFLITKLESMMKGK